MSDIFSCVFDNQIQKVKFLFVISYVFRSVLKITILKLFVELDVYSLKCMRVGGGVHFFQEPKPIFEVSHIIISFLSPIISYSNSSYFRISLWNLVNIPIRPVIFQGCAVEFYSIVNTIFQVLNPLSYCPVPALSQFDEVNSIFILTLQLLQF